MLDCEIDPILHIWSIFCTGQLTKVTLRLTSINLEKRKCIDQGKEIDTNHTNCNSSNPLETQKTCPLLPRQILHLVTSGFYVTFIVYIISGQTDQSNC